MSHRNTTGTASSSSQVLHDAWRRGNILRVKGLHLIAANVTPMALEAGLEEEGVHVNVRNQPRNDLRDNIVFS